MSRTFNLWTLAQAELLHLAARTHDFLAAHGLALRGEPQGRIADDPVSLAVVAPAAHADLAAGASMACPPEPPALSPPHDFGAC